MVSPGLWEVVGGERPRRKGFIARALTIIRGSAGSPSTGRRPETFEARSHRPDSPVAGEWAIRQQGNEMLIRRDLRGAVNTLFEGANSSPPELSPEAIRRLAMCGELVAIARTHVYRESFGGRDIEYVPEPEANTRIAKGLADIARGIASLLGKDAVGEPEMQDAARVGLDSIPDLRRRILIQGTSPTIQIGFRHHEPLWTVLWKTWLSWGFWTWKSRSRKIQESLPKRPSHLPPKRRLCLMKSESNLITCTSSWKKNVEPRSRLVRDSIGGRTHWDNNHDHSQM